MIFFCETISQDYIGWDPQDVTDEKDSEYGIYVFWRDDHTTKKLASSFQEFIEKIALGPGMRRLHQSYQKEYTTFFVPAVKSK